MIGRKWKIFETYDDAVKAVSGMECDQLLKRAIRRMHKAARDQHIFKKFELRWDNLYEKIYHDVSEYAVADLLYRTSKLIENSDYEKIYHELSDNYHSRSKVYAHDKANVLAAKIIDDYELTKWYDYFKRRFAIWEAGYGCICDINGTFYVYKRI